MGRVGCQPIGRIDVSAVFAQLMAKIDERKATPSEKSYTTQLLSGGVPKIGGKIIEEAENTTADGGRLDLVVCFNYGGRQELLDAINSIVEEDGREGAVTEEAIRRHLYLPDLPDPALIIRTSGAHRLSNFWLWQSSYSELYFPSTLWPAFGKDELDSALEDYAKRERRFGAV